MEIARTELAQLNEKILKTYKNEKEKAIVLQSKQENNDQIGGEADVELKAANENGKNSSSQSIQDARQESVDGKTTIETQNTVISHLETAENETSSE